MKENKIKELQEELETLHVTQDARLACNADDLDIREEIAEVEDEIDIDSIEELGIYEKDKKVYSPIIIDNRIKINKLVQAVKQLNKEVKELKED